LQTVFEWDFRNLSLKEALIVLDRNIKEFSLESDDNHFMENLLRGIIARSKDIDNIIVKAAPDWPIDKISAVDRNILRLGLFELLFSDRKEVPPKVAINESIELAKNFGSENSSRFVNGVLGAVYKELGEPGKEDTGKGVDGKSDNKAIKELLVGAVVYASHEGDIYMALVHDVFGHWTLSKGKIDPKDDQKIGTQKKIKEELGLEVTLEQELGENEYIAYDPERGKVRKKVQYFLAKSDFSDIKLGETGGLDDAKWFKLRDILDLNFYNDIMPIVTKAVNILLSKK